MPIFLNSIYGKYDGEEIVNSIKTGGISLGIKVITKGGNWRKRPSFNRIPFRFNNKLKKRELIKCIRLRPSLIPIDLNLLFIFKTVFLLCSRLNFVVERYPFVCLYTHFCIKNTSYLDSIFNRIASLSGVNTF